VLGFSGAATSRSLQPGEDNNDRGDFVFHSSDDGRQTLMATNLPVKPEADGHHNGGRKKQEKAAALPDIVFSTDG
jgi:hypothetical protein